MADVKISQLPAAPTVAASTILPVVQGGATYQASAQQIYGANRRDGIVQGVTLDASGTATVTFTFTPAFATLIKADAPSFWNYSGSDFAALVYLGMTASASGLTVQIGGGQAGATLDVHCGATGR